MLSQTQFLIIITFTSVICVTESQQSVSLYEIFPYVQFLFSSLLRCRVVVFFLPFN